MKVLMLTPSYDPIIGGTETVVKNLAIKLNEIGVETDVMTFNMDKKWEPRWKWEIKEENGFKVYRIPAFNPFTKMPNPMGHFFKVNVIPNPNFRKIIKKYDILHFHDDVDLTFPVFSWFIKKPKVFHCHTIQDTFNFYEKKLLYRYMLKKLANKYIANSKSTKEFLCNLGIKKDKIEILPNGVDIDKFKPCEKNRDNNLLLFVGRFQKRKGIHILLNSLNFLDTVVRLVIIGPNSNDQYSREIVTRIQEKHKKGKYDITCVGSVNLDDLVKWYQKASIFVCPSIIEPFGIVNVEALSCETPVVASNVNGIPDIVEDHKSGILIPPNDPVKLAEVIQYLLDNEDIRIKFGREGRKKVEREYSWNAIVKRLYSIYRQK